MQSGIPVAISDLNGDFMDDLVLLDRSNRLRVFYQTLNTSEFYFKDFGAVSLNIQHGLAVGDLDNDGLKEILTGGYYDGIKIYKSFGESGHYLQYSRTTPNFYTQNISLVDVNADGLLDIYVNDDDDSPKLFLNAGTDVFQESDIIEFTETGEAGSGNYGSVWTDFDLDGDLDLYISKCRQGVDNPLDTRRVNQLFVNTNGLFNEQAENFGLDIGEQSWVTDFVDLDNDLDLDVVVINHTGGNEIYENLGDGQYFKRDIGTSWNRVFEGLQLVVRDFDNDGLKDLLIGGVESKLFWNKGNFEFVEDLSFLGSKTATSLAVGDLNDDGFLDFYTSYAKNLIEYNNYVSDEVHFNNRNDNHFIKINLLGTKSNRDGIGTKVFLYGSNINQLQELRSGESYGITNTNAIVFGLPAGQTVDSLVVVWPEGSKFSYSNIDINQHYIISQDSTILHPVQLQFPEEPFLCVSDPFRIRTVLDFNEYTWSNGKATQEISADEPGYYHVSVLGSDSVEIKSGIVKVEKVDNTAKPAIDISDPKRLYCMDDDVVLHSDFTDLIWSNGVETSTNYTKANGTHYFDYFLCGESYRSDSLLLPVLEIDLPLFKEDTIIAGEEGIFAAQSEAIAWYEHPEDDEPVYIGPSFSVGLLYKDSTLFVENRRDSFALDSVFKSFDIEMTDFPGDNINGGLIFSVEEFQTTLKSVQCFTDTTAIRKFQVKDYWGSIIAEREVMVYKDSVHIVLDIALSPSNYYLLTTDEVTNFNHLGTKSPRLKRSLSNEGIYPINSGTGNVRIVASTGAQDVYYSFYNLLFEDFDISCTSEKVAVTIHVDQQSGVGEIISSRHKVFPNPTSQRLNIENLGNEEYGFTIYDLEGRVKLQGTVISGLIDVSELNGGMYILRLANEVHKFVKI